MAIFRYYLLDQQKEETKLNKINERNQFSFLFIVAAICSIRIISKRRSGSVFLSSANVSFFHFPLRMLVFYFCKIIDNVFVHAGCFCYVTASNLDKSRWKSRGIVSLSRTCWKSIRRGYATCFHCASKLWTKHKFS